MQELISFLIPLALCFGLGGLAALLFQKPFGHALPVALLGSGALLYLGTVGSGRLWGGGLLVAVAAVAGCAFLAKRRPSPGNVRALLLTPGLLAFLVLYSYLFVLHSGRGFAWWDEFSHWGTMVREILRTGTLYTAEGSLLAVHQDYPPFFQLIEAAWCALTGGYREETLYRALHTVLLSLLLPVLEVAPGAPGQAAAKPRKFSVFFALGGLVLIVLSCGVVCGDVPFFTSVYLDAAMGLLFAHGVLRLLLTDAPGQKGVGAPTAKPDLFAVVDIALTGTALLLTKQMALAFYLLLAAFTLVCWLRRGQVKAVLGALLPPLVLWQSWALHLRLRGVTGQFRIAVSDFFRLPAIYNGTAGEDWQKTACFNYVSAIWGKNIWAGSGGRMEFSYRHLIVIFALALLALTVITRKRFGLRRLLVLDGLLVAGSAAFALLMGGMYTFSFGPVEGPTLASFVRYLSSYWFAVGCVIVVLLLGWLADSGMPPRRAAVLLAAALALVLAEQLWEQPKNVARLVGARDVSEAAEPARAMADAILGQLPEDADKAEPAALYLVDRGSESDTAHALRYYLYPHRINADGFCPGPARYEGDAWAQPDLTPGDCRWRMQGFDYLCLLLVDESYRAQYGTLFADVPQSYTTYRIEDNGGVTALSQAAGQA